MEFEEELLTGVNGNASSHPKDPIFEKMDNHLSARNL